jgi:hypothetical protein
MKRRRREQRELNGWTTNMCLALQFLKEQLPNGWEVHARSCTHMAYFNQVGKHYKGVPINHSFVFNAAYRTLYAHDDWTLRLLKKLEVPYVSIEQSKLYEHEIGLDD